MSVVLNQKITFPQRTSILNCGQVFQVNKEKLTKSYPLDTKAIDMYKADNYSYFQIYKTETHKARATHPRLQKQSIAFKDQNLGLSESKAAEAGFFY